MAKGTVKWFTPTKGYRFIRPQGGGKDVFVHISAVERVGMKQEQVKEAVRHAADIASKKVKLSDFKESP